MTDRRSTAATGEAMPAYVVLHDATIDGIVRAWPTTLDELRGVPGALKAPRVPAVVKNMPSHLSSSRGPIELPPLVAAFVEATNSFDLDRLMVTFADDALVNDQLRDYWGKAAIRRWAERDIIGDRLTIAVTKVVRNYDSFVVTAEIDGSFDKRGLPDPLVLAFYFTAHDDLIVQLIILRNRRDI